MVYYLMTAPKGNLIFVVGPISESDDSSNSDSDSISNSCFITDDTSYSESITAYDGEFWSRFILQ